MKSFICKYRVVIILLVVVIVLITGYFCIKSFSEKEETPTTEIKEKSASFGLTDISLISQIRLADENVVINISNNGDGVDYQLETLENFAPDLSALEKVSLAVTAVTTEYVMDADGTDLSQFGLDDPTDIVVRDISGEDHILSIGNLDPTEEYRYVFDENKNIGKILGYYAEILMYDQHDLREKRLFPGRVSKDISSVSFSKQNELVISMRPSGTMWEINAPFISTANTDMVYSFVDQIINLSAEKFIGKTGDTKNYNLDDPEIVYSVRFVDDEEVSIYLSAAEDGGYYAYSTLTDDIFYVVAEDLAYTDSTMSDFAGGLVKLVNINDLSEIKLHLDGNTHLYKVVTKDGENQLFMVDGHDVTDLEDESGKNLFTQHYESLIGLSYKGIDVNEPAGEKSIVMSIEYVMHDGNKLSVYLASFGNDALYAYIDDIYCGVKLDFDQLDQENGVRDTLKKLLKSMK